MKLIINIPCYNEEQTLPVVLAELPTMIEGISELEIQVIDDGSTDQTSAVADQFGCRVIRHKQNQGLGYTFKTGLETALEHGCDIMVNTDGDNQYPARYIPQLIAPILAGQADIVIGNRRPWQVSHFSRPKRVLQFLGNLLTRKIANADVPDTVSGFRAYSREALLRLNIITRFSYTLDTIVQASKKDLKIVSIPIQTNKPTRASRLFKHIFQHIIISMMNILRIYVIYEPFKTFLWAAIMFLLPGLLLLARFFFFFLTGNGAGHIQSVIISAIFIILAGGMFSLGVLADLSGINRQHIEEQLYFIKKTYYR
jgi:glycosyltransferase involved in cell wall biosynthesis